MQDTVEYIIVILGVDRYDASDITLYVTSKNTNDIEMLSSDPCKAVGYLSSKVAANDIISFRKYWMREAENNFNIDIRDIKIYQKISKYIEVLIY